MSEEEKMIDDLLEKTRWGDYIYSKEEMFDCLYKYKKNGYKDSSYKCVRLIYLKFNVLLKERTRRSFKEWLFRE